MSINIIIEELTVGDTVDLRCKPRACDRVTTHRFDGSILSGISSPDPAMVAKYRDTYQFSCVECTNSFCYRQENLPIPEDFSQTQ